jgi:hypothetical protein
VSTAIPATMPMNLLPSQLTVKHQQEQKQMQLRIQNSQSAQNKPHSLQELPPVEPTQSKRFLGRMRTGASSAQYCVYFSNSDPPERNMDPKKFGYTTRVNLDGPSKWPYIIARQFPSVGKNNFAYIVAKLYITS